MAIPTVGSYHVWLTQKLNSVSPDIDTDVFVSYIIGILDNEDDNEEKLESISGLLEAFMELDTATEVSKAIVDEWMAACEAKKQDDTTDDLGEKLSEIMEKTTLATVKEKQLTDEEKSRKAAILAQYGEISDGEETDEDEDEESEKQSSGDSGLMSKNVNKQMVEKSLKEQREKSKAETEKKKEKDKLDRAAQKQKEEERKQTEKKRTQKGEKRR